MRPRRVTRRPLLVSFTTLFALGAQGFGTQTTFALPTGIATPGCVGCHAASGFDGEVSLDPSAPLDPGQATDFALVVRETQMSVAGLYLTTLGTGALAAGSGARVIGGEIVHSRPFAASEGEVNVAFSWTAPEGKGGVEFLVSVVAADGNGEPANDRAASWVFSRTWGCDGITLHHDIDGDGFGDDADVIRRCEAEPGWVDVGGDCIDFRDTVYPGAAEVANGRDDDCDGETDEGIEIAILYPDLDGDGFGSPLGAAMEGELGLEGYSPNSEDCDDSDPETHPDAAEVCDARDQDCDGTLDEGTYEYCGVGRCIVRLEICDRVCVPLSPFVEQCNGLDDDCDGELDEGDLCPPGQRCDGACLADVATGGAGGTPIVPVASAGAEPESLAEGGPGSSHAGDLGGGGSRDRSDTMAEPPACPTSPGAPDAGALTKRTETHSACSVRPERSNFLVVVLALVPVAWRRRMHAGSVRPLRSLPERRPRSTIAGTSRSREALGGAHCDTVTSATCSPT